MHRLSLFLWNFLVPAPLLQTVRWSHWLLSHAASWQRDDMRLRDLMPRVGTLPLGSGGQENGGMRQRCTSVHHTLSLTDVSAL
jgi:argininosuccinate lyase